MGAAGPQYENSKPRMPSTRDTKIFSSHRYFQPVIGIFSAHTRSDVWFRYKSPLALMKIECHGDADGWAGCPEGQCVRAQTWPMGLGRAAIN